MARHLFLTGEKRVGKSTLVRALLAGYPGVVGGFFTVKAEGVVPGRVSVHLLRAGGREIPAADNLLFCCGDSDAGAAAARFDVLGCAALEAVPAPGLLVMDELGPHEGEAAVFRRAVLAALEGDVPILGVLQRCSAPFPAQIAAHPRVQVVEVTPDNRDRLARTLVLPGTQRSVACAGPGSLA